MHFAVFSGVKYVKQPEQDLICSLKVEVISPVPSDQPVCQSALHL